MSSDHEFSLNCLIWGHAPSRLFIVNVPGTGTVYSLKGLIKLENPNAFRDVDARDIDVHKAFIPDNEGLEEKLKGLTLDAPLRPSRKLSTYFAHLPEEHLHIQISTPFRCVPIVAACCHD